MVIIPESGKPADLDKTKIKTMADADRVIAWLLEVSADMVRQFEETKDPDPAWLKRAKSAHWWTRHILHQVREAREVMAGTMTAREAVGSVICEFLDDDELEELEDMITEKYPHLAGIVLQDVFR